MKTIFSPHNIEILLWCHTRPEPYPHRDSLAAEETLGEFVRMGVIVPEMSEPDMFSTTPLGKAWVSALCNTPPPKSVFVDEMGRVLE